MDFITRKKIGIIGVIFGIALIALGVMIFKQSIKVVNTGNDFMSELKNKNYSVEITKPEVGVIN